MKEQEDSTLVLLQGNVLLNPDIKEQLSVSPAPSRNENTERLKQDGDRRVGSHQHVLTHTM